MEQKKLDLANLILIVQVTDNGPISGPRIEPIFLDPDSIPLTHETWQSSKASMIVIEIRFNLSIKLQNMRKIFEVLNSGTFSVILICLEKADL